MMIAAASLTVGSMSSTPVAAREPAASAPGLPSSAGSGGGGQSISVTVPRLVFASPNWLPLRMYVVEYADGSALAADGVVDCAVPPDVVNDGCLLQRADGTVWFVVLAS